MIRSGWICDAKTDGNSIKETDARRGAVDFRKIITNEEDDFVFAFAHFFGADLEERDGPGQAPLLAPDLACRLLANRGVP